MSELFSNMSHKGKPYQFKLLIEQRLNALFIIANQEVTKDIISFIEKIDVPVLGATTTIHELIYTEPGKIIPLITTVFPKTASIFLVVQGTVVPKAVVLVGHLRRGRHVIRPPPVPAHHGTKQVWNCLVHPADTVQWP